MKKMIGLFAALALALAAAPAFANHLQPLEPKEITNEGAKKHFDLGVQAFMNDDFDEAANHFQAAAEVAPDVPEIHIDLAMAMAAAGKTETARKHFDEATNLIAQTEPSPESPEQG
jgi:Flp pilus assembly protein TadD